MKSLKVFGCVVCLREDRSHNGYKISAMSEMVKTQYSFQLLQADHSRGATHKPDDRRV